MKHIIVNFLPFQLNQDIMVYIDGNCVEQAHVPVEEITKVVKGLSNKYNIQTIDLWGNQDYLLKYKSDFNTTFNNESVEINIYNK